ncbi:replication-relaxation family protein [Streptomyces buecherae]|uniref:replication-relaxation family protein n=1 Tax=Streptomyces buecherae TaxID=2763006 RepID=UPI0036BCD988
MARAGAELRGEVLLALAQLRLAKPRQLKELLLPHQQGTDHVRRALRNLLAESPALVGRTHRAQQSYWYCTPAGLAEAAASGELPPRSGWTTGQRAAAKTGLREHGLALVDAVLTFQRAELAEWTDWQIELVHPTPAGNLVPDGVALLADGAHAFVEIDRTTSYARLLAKLERYGTCRNAPPTGCGNAARPPRAATGRRPTPARTWSGRSRQCCSSSPRPGAARRRPPARPPSTNGPPTCRRSASATG